MLYGLPHLINQPHFVRINFWFNCSQGFAVYPLAPILVCTVQCTVQGHLETRKPNRLQHISDTSAQALMTSNVHLSSLKAFIDHSCWYIWQNPVKISCYNFGLVLAKFQSMNIAKTVCIDFLRCHIASILFPSVKCCVMLIMIDVNVVCFFSLAFGMTGKIYKRVVGQTDILTTSLQASKLRQ